MKILPFQKVILDPAAGWPEIRNAHPSVVKVFFYVVVPCLLLPPIMLIYVGEHHTTHFIPGPEEIPWELIAPIIFPIELLTFAATVQIIKNISDTYGGSINYYESYLITSVSIVPPCLAFLALAVPSLGFIGAMLFGAICYSCLTLYQGICSLSLLKEKIHSIHVTYTAIGATGSWICLLLLSAVLVLQEHNASY